jgi:hypothetical protein
MSFSVIRSHKELDSLSRRRIRQEPKSSGRKCALGSIR